MLHVYVCMYMYTHIYIHTLLRCALQENLFFCLNVNKFTLQVLYNHHLGGNKNRSKYSDTASQFFHRKAKKTTRRNVLNVLLRVFMRGTMQLATVETKTSRTAMTASSTLMSLPRRVRAVAFSSPSNWTTCCCCCCSSIFEMRVWQASSASCGMRTVGEWGIYQSGAIYNVVDYTRQAYILTFSKKHFILQGRKGRHS